MALTLLLNRFHWDKEAKTLRANKSDLPYIGQTLLVPEVIDVFSSDTEKTVTFQIYTNKGGIWHYRTDSNIKTVQYLEIDSNR